MGFLFDLLGSLFGYVLWFFFDATSNYAIAILLFAAVVNIIMFPIAIKRQKTMAINARLSIKQRELQKRFGKDKQKYNEELAKLYEREGANPLSGCFSSMVLPLVLWGGIYGAITKPLQNTLHISQDKILAASNLVATIPGAGTTYSSGYEQLQIVKLFESIKPHLTMFNMEEIADIKEYSSGFNLFGLDLLNRPNNAPFNSMLWIIPLFCFLSSVLSMYFMQKINGNANQVQGAMKFMPYMMFIFTAYIAYTIPGAVGLYWIFNALIGMMQSIVISKYYNTFTLNAKEESICFNDLKEKEKTICECSKLEDFTQNDQPPQVKQKRFGKR